MRYLIAICLLLLLLTSCAYAQDVGTPTGISVSVSDPVEGSNAVTGSNRDGWVYRTITVKIPAQRVEVYSHLDLPEWSSERERQSRCQIREFLSKTEKKRHARFSPQYKQEFEARGIELMRGNAAHFPFHRPNWSWDAQYQVVELLTQFLRYYGYTKELCFTVEIPWMPCYQYRKLDRLPSRESCLTACQPCPQTRRGSLPTNASLGTKVLYQLGWSLGAIWPDNPEFREENPYCSRDGGAPSDPGGHHVYDNPAYVPGLSDQPIDR